MIATQAKTLADYPEYAEANAQLASSRVREYELRNEIADLQAQFRVDQAAERTEFLRKALKERNSEFSKISQEIERFQQRVNSARGAASKTICELAKPAHDQALREMTLALIKAGKEAIAAARIRESLEQDDISTATLVGPTFPEIGRSIADPCSLMHYFIREALQCGLINRNEVPAQWRAAWEL